MSKQTAARIGRVRTPIGRRSFLKTALASAVGASAYVSLARDMAAFADTSGPSDSRNGMSMKPIIILVHGFWGGAAHWSKVIVTLNGMGYTALHAVENPLTSLADDAERTRKMIAQQKGPVLLVGHSYGGAVITEAGTAPNVAGLVYVAAFAPDAGESLADVMGAAPAPAGAANVAPDSDGFVWINPQKFHESFCQDVSPDEALVMAVTQKAPVGSTFANKVTQPAWKSKPSWYQVSTEDRMIHPDNQNRMAARLGAKKMIALKASHASLVSKAAEVCALIDEAARTITD